MSQTKELGKDLAHQSKTKRYELLRNIIVVGAVAYFLTVLTLPDDYVFYYNPLVDTFDDLEEFEYYFLSVFAVVFSFYIYFFYTGKFKKIFDYFLSFFGFAGAGRFHDLFKNLVYQQPIFIDGLLRNKAKLSLFSKKRNTSISKLFDYEDNNPTTARIVKYFRSNSHYIDLFKIIEGYLNNGQYDVIYEISGKKAKNPEHYKAFNDGYVCFSPEIIKKELNRLTKDFDRYLQANIRKPTSVSRNLRSMQKKEHNKLVDIFAFITFHRLISNFSNIPTGLIESKLNDYDFRRIINSYVAEGFTIEISDDNNGTNKNFNNDTFSATFLTLYHKYMHGSSELDPLHIIKKFDPLNEIKFEENVLKPDIDFSINSDFTPSEESLLVNKEFSENSLSNQEFANGNN